jgi:nucleotide-binding universal stress UspA family protein
MRAVLDRRGEQFRAVAKSQVQDVEWRSALEFPTEFVAREARAADLVVVGGDSESGSEYESLNRAALILKAGRPILTVPNGVQSLRAKCIAVAWKETREARRALADALPFLVEAEGVFLVEVAESGAADEAQRHLGDIARYLGRHGINAIAERVRPFEVDVSSVLFRLAKDENIDLVVAGGYGHSRLGEWMFGGVTRELLGSSPVCCLFSH